MANPDRRSGLDASFLSLERSGAHMHVGSVLVFEGEAPPYEEFVSKLEQRLHLVPRYRQKLAWPPLVLVAQIAGRPLFALLARHGGYEPVLNATLVVAVAAGLVTAVL